MDKLKLKSQSVIYVDVVEEPITLVDLQSFIPDTSHGASDTFVGYVRNINLGKKVVAVEYDCFTPLTKKVFSEIAIEAQKKWSQDARFFILHRQGKLAVGEISVLICVSTRHRDESFKACRYVIEEIKKRAPIWKKEHYEVTAGGVSETEWVQGHALCQHGPKVDHVQEFN